MTRSEIVKGLFSSIEAKDIAAARARLTPNFEFAGAVPQPITAEMWLGMHSALSAGFSDFSFNANNVKEEGDKVTMTVALSGTHDGTLALPLPGASPVAATGRKVTLPEEHVAVEFAGDKISRVFVTPHPQGGPANILRQVTA